MWHPPSTVERAFELASNVENNYKSWTVSKWISLPTHPVNSMKWAWKKHPEMSKNSTRCQRGKKWEVIQITTTTSILVLVIIMATATNSNSTDLKRTDKPNSGHNGQKTSKITLTWESDHYLPTEISGNFFKQFDLAMKLKREELKR